MTTFPTTRALSRAAGRDKITVDGVDVTDFRGSHTPFPRYTLMEPFGYGSTSLQFPQIHATFEAGDFGAGELSWVREGARVVISRVFDASEVIDYVGVVIAREVYGRILNLDVGGEFAGRAALLNFQNPIFRRLADVGHWAYLATSAVHIPFTPWNGPTTGIEVVASGGQTLLSWAQYIGAMSQQADGSQRALMPATWGAKTYEFEPKDFDTVHYTAFPDDARVVLQVVDDASEQPTTWYGNGVTRDGERWQNAKWPGVFQGTPDAYPIAGAAPFGSGTTNGDTIDGDGITTLQINLKNRGYMPFNTPPSATYNTAFVKAVKLLQADANLSTTGIMTVAAWNALFDLEVTGYDLNGARIFPLVEDSRTRFFNFSSSGNVIGVNDDFDATVLTVERNVEFGAGVDEGTGRAWCAGQKARLGGKNWVGTLRLNGVGLFAGDHADETGLIEDDVRSFRDVRPGQNVRIPYFDNGTLFHVAGLDVDADGATLTIDTQARDLMELREIIDRNRESRRDIRREWMSTNRAARPSGNMVTRDVNFGRLRNKVELEGDRWNVFPVIVGQHGQVNRVDLRLVNDEARFAVAVFATKITEKRLNRRVGNPLTVAGGESAWEKEGLQDWYDDRVLLYAAGDENQPCGYFPRRFKNDEGTETGAPITGRHVDDSPWPYICAAGTAVLVYMAIYPDRDCVLRRGQILYAQLDDAI